MNRNIYILSVCQGFGMSGAPMVILLGGIIGAQLAPYPSWATLPIAFMIIGVALFTVPASLIMKKIGRRFGFMGAVGVGALAALELAYAIHVENFFLFCVGTLFIGGNTAFVQQYRFAAAESVETSLSGKAISYVLIGGIFGGYFGPEVAKRTKDWFEAAEYSGSFVSLAIVYVFTAGLLFFIREIKPKEDATTSGEERPLMKIVTQPLYYSALVAAVVGYGVMTLIMTATPISMHVMDGYSIDETAWVIQSHVIAMYLPSLFTGTLIQRFGVFKVMTAGVICLFLCVGIATFQSQMLNYWGALVFLGVGWNFLFIGGTTLLTQNYRSSERFKAQAFNDFTVFGIQAFMSLFAGTLIYWIGWNSLNFLTIPVLCLMLLLIFLRRNKGGHSAPSLSS